jgi:hypothetical protein
MFTTLNDFCSIKKFSIFLEASDINAYFAERIITAYIVLPSLVGCHPVSTLIWDVGMQ